MLFISCWPVHSIVLHFVLVFFFRLLPVLGNTFRVYSRYDGGGDHKLADPPDTPLQIEVFLEKDSWCFGSDKFFCFSLVRVALGLISFFFTGTWVIAGRSAYKQQFTRGGWGGRGWDTPGLFGWRCVTGTMEPLAYTRATSAESSYPTPD